MPRPHHRTTTTAPETAVQAATAQGRKTRPSGRLLPLLAMAASPMLVGSAGHADIYTFQNGWNIIYYAQDMPDFDQKRAGLDWDGACHCGPANGTNLLGYIATHAPSIGTDIGPGAPSVAWNEPGMYAHITDYIRDYAATAGTTGPSDGCSTTWSEMRNWIEDAGEGWVGRNFDVSYVGWNRNDPTSTVPRVRPFGNRLVAEEGIGIAFRGTFHGSTDADGSWHAQAPILLGSWWSGGHYMAVKSGVMTDDLGILQLRHSSGPESPTGLHNQSDFATTTYDFAPRGVRLLQVVEPEDGEDGGPTVHETFRTFDQLGDEFSASTSLVIDEGDPADDSDDVTLRITTDRIHVFYGYLIVSPKCWFEWEEGDRILERVPGGISIGGGSTGPGSMFASFDEPIREAVRCSSGRTLAVLAGPRIHKVTPTGLTDMDVDAIDLPLDDVAALAFDRSFRLHAVGGRTLTAIDWNESEILGTATLPAEGTAVTVIDERPHVLMPELQAVASVTPGGPDEDPVVTILPLPHDVTAGPDSTLEMLPGGWLLLLDDGWVQPMRITATGLESIQMPIPRNGQWTRMVRAGDRSLCLADAQGRVEVMELRPNGMFRDFEHAFDGRQTEANFLPSRGHGTGDGFAPQPAYEDGPDDAGEHRIDCLGDLNLDGRVDSADVGLLLGEWGSVHSIADLNDDDQVDSADLGIMLGRYGSCA